MRGDALQERLDAVFAEQVNRVPRPLSTSVLEHLPVNSAQNSKPKKEYLHISCELRGRRRVERRVVVSGSANKAITGPQSTQEQFEISVTQRKQRFWDPLFRSPLSKQPELFRP